MSWDVLVLNYEGSPPADMDEMSTCPEPVPLGHADAVREAISRHLDEVNWADPTYGVYETDEYSIEFPIGDEDMVDCIMLHVRGSGDAIAALIKFSQPNNWSLFDCSTSEIINPDKPSHKGW